MKKIISPYIIAEAGVNHNGNEKTAFELVDAAVAAGVDAIKFQTFIAEKLVTPYADMARYQQENSGTKGSQYEMLKSLEMSRTLHRQLLSYCQKAGIQFLSTAFDEESLHFLTNDLELPVLKIGSGELTNGPFLLAHAVLKKRIIVSTGMSTLDEIRDALGVIAFGLLGMAKPGLKNFMHAFNSAEGQALLREYVTLLHCTTNYPAAPRELNLMAIRTLKDNFGLPVGYSDHSEGIFASVIAASLGAVVIEKHFTLDRSLPGPDHKASLEPDQLADLVKKVKQVGVVLGDGEKKPTDDEMRNRDVARKSLVSIGEIAPGDLFTEQNISAKRPGTGLSPMRYWDIIGIRSTKKYQPDELVENGK